MTLGCLLYDSEQISLANVFDCISVHDTLNITMPQVCEAALVLCLLNKTKNERYISTEENVDCVSYSHVLMCLAHQTLLS